MLIWNWISSVQSRNLIVSTGNFGLCWRVRGKIVIWLVRHSVDSHLMAQWSINSWLMDCLRHNCEQICDISFWYTSYWLAIMIMVRHYKNYQFIWNIITQWSGNYSLELLQLHEDTRIARFNTSNWVFASYRSSILFIWENAHVTSQHDWLITPPRTCWMLLIWILT